MEHIIVRKANGGGFTFKYYMNTETGRVTEAYQMVYEGDGLWHE